MRQIKAVHKRVLNKKKFRLQRKEKRKRLQFPTSKAHKIQNKKLFEGDESVNKSRKLEEKEYKKKLVSSLNGELENKNAKEHEYCETKFTDLKSNEEREDLVKDSETERNESDYYLDETIKNIFKQLDFDNETKEDKLNKKDDLDEIQQLLTSNKSEIEAKKEDKNLGFFESQKTTNLIADFEEIINKDEKQSSDHTDKDDQAIYNIQESQFNIGLLDSHGDNFNFQEDINNYDNSYSNDLGEILKTLEGEVGYQKIKCQLEKLKEEKLRLTKPFGFKKQEKIDRGTKYDFVKKDMKKWIPQIIRNKESDQLRFGFENKSNPLAIEDLSTSFSVETNFEKELNDAIISSNLTNRNLDEDEIDDLLFEENQLAAHMNDSQYDKERTDKVRKLKALMFREQQRSRRLNKIKSKIWHKIKNKSEVKEREKLLLRLQAEDPDLAADLREQYEKKRAHLRMLKQHAARKKWSQMALRFGGLHAQKIVTQQVQRAHDEKATIEKIAKQLPASNFYGGEDDTEEESEDEGDKTHEKSDSLEYVTAKTKLEVLKELTKSDDAIPESGILNLNFMRNALEKKREENKKFGAKLLSEIEATGCDKKEAILRLKDDYKYKSDEENYNSEDISEKKKKKKNNCQKLANLKYLRLAKI